MHWRTSAATGRARAAAASSNHCFHSGGTGTFTTGQRSAAAGGSTDGSGVAGGIGCNPSIVLGYRATVAV